MGTRGAPHVEIVAANVAAGPRVVVPLVDRGLTETLTELDRRLDVVLAQGPRTLVVDMAAVEHISSTTIAALLWVRRRCTPRSTGVLLRRPSRHCLDELGRVGLLGSFAVEQDAQDDRQPRRPGTSNRSGSSSA